MRRRTTLLASVAAAVALAAAAGLRAAQQPVPPGGDPPVKPLFVLLQLTIDDPFHIELCEERLQRALDLVQRVAQANPAAAPSCLVQFSGTGAQALLDRNGATHLVDRLKDAVGKGQAEIGYDGTEEPTFVARPRPNFRRARTPEDRWAARSEAAAWFLEEFKDPLTGAPDPDRAGGLRRVREIFGEVRSIAGVSLELGGDPEWVHLIRRQPFDGVMTGLPEGSAHPARLLHGYRNGSAMHSRILSPDEDMIPELFFQDNVLRLSETSGEPVKVFNAVEGPDALQKYLAGIDRSHPHVLRLRLGHPSIHVKADFMGGRYASPLQYVYDNPKGARLPEQGWEAPEAMAAARAREDAVVAWLSGEFFTKNPGSRFVSPGALARRTASGAGTGVEAAALRAATIGLLAEWETVGNNPPSFARGPSHDYSLADMFQLLATALAGYRATGALPASVVLHQAYGPLEMREDEGPRDGSVPRVAVVEAAGRLATAFAPGAWTPVPTNVVPTTVEVGGLRLNAAQFLRLMAETYLEPGAGAALRVRPAYMFSAVAEGLPRTRPRSDVGAGWTLKPARIGW